MVAKQLGINVNKNKRYNLAKILMVAKLNEKTFIDVVGYNLAKILMVAKLEEIYHQ